MKLLKRFNQIKPASAGFFIPVRLLRIVNFNLTIAMRLFFISSIFLLSACSDQICGEIQTNDGLPIANASVGWQTSSKRVLSDDNGLFCLDKKENLSIIAAWADGHLIGGVQIKPNTVIKNNTITLPVIPEASLTAKDYIWFDSTPVKDKHYPELIPTSNEPCSACHPRLSQEWKKSAHGNTHKNALFTQVLNIIPQSRQGKCLQCHNPQQHNNINNLKQPIGCDYCHKINKVHTTQPEVFGSKRIQHHIPKDGALAFGQLDDPVGRNDYYAPLYEKSEYCSACHEASFWHTPIYSTFSEWKKSPQAKQQIQCQDCHMKTTEQFSAAPSLGGKQRDPSTLSSHDFKFSKKRISKAIEFSISKEMKDNELNLYVNLTNIGAGHDIPTGNPMHHLLLTVNVKDKSGSKIKKIAGKQLPSWSVFNEKSGAVMAKILTQKVGYENSNNTVYPSPFWLPSIIESDTRLKPNQRQQHTFRFAQSTYYKIEIQLWYVKHYANWQGLSDSKPWLLHEWKNEINLKSYN